MAKAIRQILNNDTKFNMVVRLAFDSVDTDKSGQIDEKELEKVMINIAIDMGAEPPTKKDVKQVMEHLDTDKSGYISFDEFKVLIKDILESMLESE